MSRCLVDTAVFVYADGPPHPLRTPCRNVLQLAADGSIELEASAVLLEEFAYVQLRKGRDRDHVAARGLEIAIACRMHAVEPRDATLMLVLLGRQDTVGAREALFAATALNRGIKTVISPDPDFDPFEGLQRIDPLDEEAVAALAASSAPSAD